MEHAEFLKSCALFSGLNKKALNALAAKLTEQSLRGGETLYTAGATADEIFIVSHGRLRLFDADGNISREVGPGDPIGVISIISGEARSTTAVAARDSTVVVISRQDLLDVLNAQPQATLELAKLVVERVRMSREERVRRDLGTARSIALVAADDSVPLATVARDLSIALGDVAPSLRIDRDRISDALGGDAADVVFEDSRNADIVRWLNQQEDQYRYLIYQGDEADSPWTRRCLRQADRVLMLVNADSPVSRNELVERVAEVTGRMPVEIVFLHEGSLSATVRPMAWREAIGCSAHQHIRIGDTGDMARMGRLVTGRAVGVTFGGGGARGVAHLGLIRAMNERDIPIDLVGGCSIGAFLAALIAFGMSYTEIVATMRRLFVDNNNLNDYTVPRVSLIGARKMRARMEEIFGDTMIENLKIPYFATSTNITQGELMVHDRGLVAHWVGTSMSVPGIAPPVVYRGDLLVDGGVINSLPTDVMQSLQRGPIVASDVTAEDTLSVEGVEGPDTEQIIARRGKGRSPNIFKILFRTATLNAVESRDARAESADLYIRMPIQGIGMFDWDAFDRVLGESYDHASRELDRYLRTHRLGR